tara:strand:- start:1182 stop:1367 length:186 start_codon:yes stop_codon:yes gene_type:complete
MPSSIRRIQITPATEKDSDLIEKLSKEWGCSEGKLVSTALHEWLRTNCTSEFFFEKQGAKL